MTGSNVLALLALGALCAGCGPQGPKPTDIPVIHGGGLMKAGQQFDTPCYSIVVAVDSRGSNVGCDLKLASAGADAQAGPLGQYLTLDMETDNALPSGLPLDQKMQRVLDTVKQGKQAQATADSQTADIFSGPYDNARGFFQGVKPVVVAGKPAREAVWGFEQADPRVARMCQALAAHGSACPPHLDNQTAVILVDVPPSRFTLNGAPVSAVMITAYTRGPRAEASQGALSHLTFKF